MTKDQVRENCLNVLENEFRATAALGTGVGKTLLGLSYLEQNFEKVNKCLVVAPGKDVKKTWKEEAEKYNKTHLLKKIVFSTYRSLVKLSPNDFDLLILDECHNLLYKHTLFLDFYTERILGLTGSPPKHPRSEKYKMIEKYCPIKFTYLADDAVDDKLLNNYKIYVHLLDLDSKRTIEKKTKTGATFKTSEKSEYDFWTSKIENEVYKKEMLRIIRMKSLMSFPSKEKYAKLLMESISSKVIVFANTTEQADRICSNSYHNKSKNPEQTLNNFKSGKINKLASVFQLNEGVNIPNLKQCIIMHMYSGNSSSSRQRIGRMLRLNPDDTSIIHVLCYKGTIDQVWVEDALEHFNPDKIVWKEYKI